MSIKVIGAGFGRTGTSSLKAALEDLGFNKCYHMQEVHKYPSHAKVWNDAMMGKPVDWEGLLQGYQATLDWPACTFYQELMKQYPEAKVLLTVRDPEKWYDSTINTIHRSSGKALMNQVGRLTTQKWTLFEMINNIIWQGTFHGQFENKAHAISVFKWHIETVKQIVPPERLLVYEVKQGWEPLCQFLNVPVPDKPFPHLNDRVEFEQMIQKRLQTTSYVGGGVLVLLALLIAGLMIKKQRKS